MARKILPFLAVLFLLGTFLPGPASFASPPTQAPEPFPFSDRYPAEIILTTSEALTLLVNSGVDIGNVRTQDPNRTFPRPGERFVPLVATVYINTGEAARLLTLGLVAQPIDNPSVPDYPGGPTACSGWPSYNTLVTRMQNLANAYPNIVRLVDIGDSVNGRNLWMIKITDNPDVEENEPEFRFSSTHHGTEGVGTEMTLRLAELLASSYGVDPELTTLVNEIEIWLWPLFNPDGYEACTYYNAHGVNLNRDFPDRFNDPNNTPAGREPETQAAWYFQEAHTIVAGANYHTGALVANVPWDATAPNDPPAFPPVYAPDDASLVDFGAGYAARNPDMLNGGFPNGWTYGWDWYQIWGGMQDWTYNWYSEHHITFEISDYQPPPYGQMDHYWDMNRDAMLWAIGRVLTGARGLVTDACTGAPLDASVDAAEILKPVPTDPDVGDYHRLLLPGTYTLIASASGYQSQSASVTVVSGTATVQNFALAAGNTYTVQGTVTDATTGAPLAATIELIGTQIVTNTNPVNGHYVLHLCPGTYTFHVSAPQHQPEERQVNVNGNRTEDFALAGYGVAAGSSERSGAPGETVTHTLTITNAGGLTDTYALTLVPGGWPASLLTPQVGPLVPGDSGAAMVVVQIPYTPLTQTVLFSDVFSLHVTSTTVPEVGTQATGTTNAIADLAVALGTAQDSLGGPAGTPVTYTLFLTNTGAYTDSYALTPQGNAWPTTVLPPQSAPLGPGASAQVLVRVDIPGAPGAPTDTVTIQATSGWDDTIQAHQTLHTAVFGAAVTAHDSQAAGAPGTTVTHTLVITNAGVFPDTYAIAVTPGDWPTTLLTPQVGPLVPGGSGAAMVAVQIPYAPLTNTTLFSDVFTLHVTSTTVPEVGTQATGTTNAIADLAVALGTAQDSLGGPVGTPVTYTLFLTNTGAYTDSYALTPQGNAWPTTVLPPQSAPLGPGASAQVLVRVDIPGAPGAPTDTVTIQATSGWDDTIQAHQTLHTAVFGAAVTAHDSQAAGAPGTTVTHTFGITNVGSLTDTYVIAVTPGDWPTTLLTPQVGPLGSGEDGIATVVVQIPYVPLTNTTLFSDVFTLHITSTAAPEVGTRTTGTTYAVADLDVELAADPPRGWGLPGAVVTYTLAITNVGAYTDTYTLEVLPGSAWGGTVLPAQTAWLGPGESGQAQVQVVIPAGPRGEQNVLTVRATSSWSASVHREVLVITGRGWGIFLPIVGK